MSKDVHLTLSSIKYTGKSIGDDIRIEIEALGEMFAKNRKIKRGATRRLDDKIGTYRIGDSSSFSLPVIIRIIERDFVLNDVNSKKIKIKVDLSESIGTLEVVD